MTNEELKKDWEVIEAATPGPWERIAVEFVLRIGNSAMDQNQINDSHFISQARTRWPEALREVERLREVLKGLLNKTREHANDYEYSDTDNYEYWSQKAEEILK